MGINAELVELLARLKAGALIEGATSVVELGAQDVSAPTAAVRAVLQRHGFDAAEASLGLAPGIYAPFGFARYLAIDAGGQRGAAPYDLNRNLEAAYGFSERFDLVTNLGTAEHVFDQGALFANVHALCRVGGIMIHCLPAQGLVNHGFYNYHPRFLADLAAANGYELISTDFTTDFKPELYPYTLANFRAHDAADVMVYGVLRKTSEAAFRAPFDSVFATINQLGGYETRAAASRVPPEEFAAYIKTSWTNATSLTPEAATDNPLAAAPLEALEAELRRRGAG